MSTRVRLGALSETSARMCVDTAALVDAEVRTVRTYWAACHPSLYAGV